MEGSGPCGGGKKPLYFFACGVGKVVPLDIGGQKIWSGLGCVLCSQVHSIKYGSPLLWVLGRPAHLSRGEGEAAFRPPLF